MSLLKAKHSKTRNIDIDSALSAATEEPLKRVNVNLPKSVYLSLKSKALRDEVSISSLIRRWIDTYIEG